MNQEQVKAQIMEAIGAHGSWKLKLRNAAQNGSLPKPAADIATDNQCAFGKWLYSMQSNPEIANSDQYRKVVTAHAKFHSEAGRIAKLIENGRPDFALKEMDSRAFTEASEILKKEMMTWKAM